METPKTAKQINLPQTGQVDVATSGSVPTSSPHPKAGPMVDRMREQFHQIYGATKVEREKHLQLPAGWWKFCDEGSIAGVLNNLEASTVPPHGKAYIKAEITNRCAGGANFVHVHAHYHLEGARGALHCDVVASKKTL